MSVDLNNVYCDSIEVRGGAGGRIIVTLCGADDDDFDQPEVFDAIEREAYLKHHGLELKE